MQSSRVAKSNSGSKKRYGIAIAKPPWLILNSYLIEEKTACVLPQVNSVASSNLTAPGYCKSNL